MNLRLLKVNYLIRFLTNILLKKLIYGKVVEDIKKKCFVQHRTVLCGEKLEIENTLFEMKGCLFVQFANM